MRFLPRLRPSPTAAEAQSTIETIRMPQLGNPDPAQLVWMSELRELLRVERTPFQLAALSERFAKYCTQWHETPVASRWNPIVSINAFGIVLGDLIRQTRPDLHWQILLDHQPTKLVLADSVPRAVASPLSDVAQWWIAQDLSAMKNYPARVQKTVVEPALLATDAAPARGDLRPQLS